jgi:hypothetical protein
VIHDDLIATLMIFGLVTFAKVKLHPPSSIMKMLSTKLDTLNFYARGGQVRRWHVAMRCQPTLYYGYYSIMK